MTGPQAYADPECVNAINAVQRVRPVVLKAPSNSLQFGLQILAAQEKVGALQQSLIAANQQLLELQKTPASADKISQQKEEITQLTESLAQQQLDVNIMLSLLRLNKI